MPDPIQAINAVSPLSVTRSTTPMAESTTALDNFGQVLSDAINNLSQREQRANQATASLAAGEDVALHQVMLAVQEADIAFQMAMQVRNKLVDAYQEVMRMQV